MIIVPSRYKSQVFSLRIASGDTHLRGATISFLGFGLIQDAHQLRLEFARMLSRQLDMRKRSSQGLSSGVSANTTESSFANILTASCLSSENIIYVGLVESNPSIICIAL